MTALEIVQSARFIVDKKGEPTKVVLNFNVWQDFIELVEDSEDRATVQQRMKNWESKVGWTSWEDFEAELDEMDSQKAMA